jgi:hypothetical protein
MMCTLFFKIEYTRSLIFITNLTNCKTFLYNNNYVGDFQVRVIGHYNPFVETPLLVLKLLTVISYLSGVFVAFYHNKTLTMTNTFNIIYDISKEAQTTVNSRILNMQTMSDIKI